MSEHEGNTPAETQEKVSENKEKGRKTVDKKNKVLESLDIQYINVNDIHPNEWNPNRQVSMTLNCSQVMKTVLLSRSLPSKLKLACKIVDGEHR